jgi:DNA-binding MarR family transcriptional regulator
MTAPQASFGQTLANAEQILTATLRRHLAEGSRTLTPGSTRELLARLEAEGLIRGDEVVDLTAEGEALHRSLREYIAGPTARLLGRFPAADIETTMRTLQAITERAEKELAEAG